VIGVEGGDEVAKALGAEAGDPAGERLAVEPAAHGGPPDLRTPALIDRVSGPAEHKGSRDGDGGDPCRYRSVKPAEARTGRW
jgi:hypothetical protein